VRLQKSIPTPPEADAKSADPDLSDLYGRPGFMLRRAHQISVALFLEETGAFNITTSQFGALHVLSRAPGLDIVSLGRRMGMDRSTSALVISKLEAAGWITVQTNPDDRRRKIFHLTDKGRETLAAMAEPATAARQRLLSAFSPEEAQNFLSLLDKFVSAFNGAIRTPIV
jgi:DNA-binding MarR family transcriptional regulator